MNTALIALALAQISGADLSADSRLDATLSNIFRAESTVTLVPKLGADAAVPLRALTTFRNEPLICRFGGVSLRDAMKAVAECVGGEWQKEESGYVLARNDAQWRTLKQADDAILNPLISEAKPRSNLGFEDRFELPAGSVRVQSEIAVAGGSSQDQDFQKYADIAAKLVPASLLTSMGIDERIVFSTRPNSMQRSLNGLAKQAFEPIAKAYRPPTRTNRPHIDPETGEVIPDDESSPGPLVGAHLVVERDNVLSWNFTLKVFDQVGRSSPIVSAINLEEAVNKLRPKLTARDPKSKIELHSISKKLMELGRTFATENPPGSFDLGAEVKEAFRKPDVVDPMFSFPTDIVLAYANDQKSSLVATFSDDFFMELGVGETKQEDLTLGDVVSSVSENILTECGTVKCLRPQFRAYAQLLRMDRKAVRHFLDAEFSTGLNFPVMKELAVTYPERSEQMLQMIGLVSGSSVMSMFGGSPDWKALRFLASLLPNQEKGVVEGSPMAFSGLSATQKGAFYYACLESGQSFFGMGADMEEMMEDLAKPTPAQPEFHYADITDLLGGQPGTSAHVLAVPSTKDVVKLTDMGRFPFPMPALTAAEYAMIRQSMDDPGSAAFSHMFPKLEPVYPGVRQILKLQFKVVPEVVISRKIFTDTVSTKSVKYAELPSAFRKAVESFKPPWGEGSPGDAPPPNDTLQPGS